MPPWTNNGSQILEVTNLSFLAHHSKKVRYCETSHQSSLEKIVEELLALARKGDSTKPGRLNPSALAAVVPPLLKDANFTQSEHEETVRIAIDAISAAEGERDNKLYLPALRSPVG